MEENVRIHPKSDALPSLFPAAGALSSALLLLSGILLAPRQALAEPPSLQVAAAADLMPVLPPLSRAFMKKTGIKVKISWGPTGEKALAIRHGAPFDLFLAADSATPERLAREGFLKKKSLRGYAEGILALWITTKALPNAQSHPDPALLSRPGIRKMALANPRLAPYGRAAVACLRAKGLWGRLKKKAVYGNSLAQVAQYLRTGTAQAGFLSKSQAMALSEGGVKGNFVVLSPKCHPFLPQEMGLVRRSKRQQEARAFEDYLLSPEAQDYLKDHGYH